MTEKRTAAKPRRRRDRLHVVPRGSTKYSRDFKPRPEPGKDPVNYGREYKMNRIPAQLWIRVQAKAKRDGVSLRWLLLSYLSAWVDGKAAA